MAQWKAKLERDVLPSPPFPMPTLLWRFLYSRGFIKKSHIEALFSPKLRDLKSPHSLSGMKESVDRLEKALVHQESICVYGDFDLDGTSAVALLKTAFEKLGYQKVSFYQPKRLSEGYGLHASAVKKLSEQKVNLIITVDLGITSLDGVAQANELNMDVIVTDHHLPGPTLPEAFAIINPNKGTCSSELGHLCGAGVAFYLVLALKMQLEKHNLLKTSFDPKTLLDCFAIATLTDLVPLVDENRVLVKHGLKALENTKRPALKSLMKALGLDGRVLTASDVAIRFAPKLNALSRLEKGVRPIDLYIEEDPLRADQIVDEVIKNNQQRIAIQNKAQTEADEFVHSHPQAGFIFVASKNFHQGVVGLIATKLVQSYNVPAFVGAIKEGGMIVGSARLPEGEYPDLVAALEHATEVLNKFGGHRQAAGFEMKAKYQAAFEKKLDEFYKHFYESVAGEIKTIIEYDTSTHLEHLSSEFMNWMGELEPFGKGFEVPLFHFEGVKIKSLKALKGGHLKLGLQCPQSKTLRQGLWFSPPPNNPLIISGLKVGQVLNVIGEPQWNHYNGQSTVQILLRDAQEAF